MRYCLKGGCHIILENSTNRQQKVPYKRQNAAPPRHDAAEKQIAPMENEKEKKKETGTGTGGFQLPFSIGEMLEGIDTDTILIIMLLAVIYKNEGSSKLLLALVYLLI